MQTEQTLFTIDQLSENYANERGYPQSDKEHMEVTYWTLHNIAAKGFIAGYKAKLESIPKEKEEVEGKKEYEKLFSLEDIKKAWAAGFNRGAEEVGSTAGQLGLKLENPSGYEYIQSLTTNTPTNGK